MARRKLAILVTALLGLAAGAGIATLRPPVLSSQAWVVLSPSARGIGTQLLIAHSDAVLTDALRTLHTGMSFGSLRGAVDAQSRAGLVIVITARDKTGAGAQHIANAVAQSYVAYVAHPGNLPDGPVMARLFQAATSASGAKPTSRLVGMGLLGASLGALAAALAVVAIGRRDRRLRERDEIADSIGVPVIASIASTSASDAAGWRTLLKEYQPGAVDAWRMRKALQYLGVADLSLSAHHSTGLSLTVVSCSFDRRALAVGPQLAVFAASRGIPTALVLGPHQDVTATATLRAACGVPLTELSSRLRVVVRDDPEQVHEPDVALTVVVTAVDADASHLAPMIPTSATVLVVSAGEATAEQLARVAATVAVGGHDVTGIIVADPDPADSTTGRLPQVERPAQLRQPTRITGSTMENRR